MKAYNQTARASITEFIASVILAVMMAGSLTLASNAVAENVDNKSFANVAECKAFYQQSKDGEMNQLKRRKQMMGAGMPDAIYSRKKRKIDAEYESNLTNCESMVTSRGR